MPVRVITPEIDRLIRAEADLGKGSKSIAKTVLDRLGIALDPRTIRRHLGKTKGLTQARNGKPKASTSTSGATQTKPAPKRAARSPKLPNDEIGSLKAQAKLIQEKLVLATFPRDVAVLSAELRQCFGQLRKAEAQLTAGAKTELTDTTWIVAKLKNFASKLPQQDDLDSDELPEEPSSSNGV